MEDLIEVVNSYKYLGIYLGIHFCCKLSWTATVQELAAKSKTRTSRILTCHTMLGDVDSSTLKKILDAQILPLLLYGSEVWGLQKCGELEKVHHFACKRLLHVSQQTPNRMIHGHLGRYTLHVNSMLRCVKFWPRLISIPHDRLPRKAYIMLVSLCDSGKKGWALSLTNVLEYGFTAAWPQQGVGTLVNI